MSEITSELACAKVAGAFLLASTFGIGGYHTFSQDQWNQHGLINGAAVLLYGASLRRQFNAQRRLYALARSRPQRQDAPYLFTQSHVLWNYAQPLFLIAADGLIGPLANPLFSVIGMGQGGVATGLAYHTRKIANGLTQP